MKQVKVFLNEKDIPRQWYNLAADLPTPLLPPLGPDGKPRIEEFGNKPKQIDEGKTIVSDEREPLTDVIEGDEEIFITVEIPGVKKDEINLNITNSTIDINVDSPTRKYQKSIDLPCYVKPDKTKATYKNGVLDIILKRKEKKKGNKGYQVSID